MKYCIYGGSFDPPHQGHKYLAQSVLAQFNLDFVLWVPSPDPPHKNKPTTPFKNRLAMVELFIADEKKFQACDIELSLPSPSYSFNTIQALKKKFGPKNEWYFLIGADNWAIFPTWHRGDELLRDVQLVVFPRENYPLHNLPNNVLGLDFPEMPIQSQDIRKKLSTDPDQAWPLIPKEIQGYIREQDLYGFKS